jgi:predicted metal-dependent peptidase
MSTKQRITQIIEKWYVIEPLFFAVWTTHELSIDSNIQNIRVGQGRIEYNPAFIAGLDDQTLEQVLQFEVMRIILKHPYLRRKENQSVAYAASNITIQEYLETPLHFPKAKEVFQTTEYDKKYFEFYYYKLLELADEEQSMMGESAQGGASGGNDKKSTERDDSPSTGGESEQETDSNDNEQKREEESPSTTSESETEIDHYIDPESSAIENTALWDENEYYSNQINEKIESALESQSWGTIPSRIQERILATLKPKVNYRQILRSFKASIISVNRVLTRMKPSRRYGFLYMGSRRDFCTKLLFAVDVSGSVTHQDIRKAFSIINQLFKYGIQSVDVLQFDAEIKDKPLSLKKAKYQVKVIGRGGTDFQPVIDYIDKHKDYDGLIIFTDGFAPVPVAPNKNRRTKILWLFNNENNYLNMKQQVRQIGRSTFIKAS